MSGIAGVVRAGGSPPDETGVAALVGAMAGRGPDARGVTADGPAALGCAALWSTPESQGEVQPLTLDGRRWLVGDLRIDDRARLTAELRSAGARVESGASDAALALHAWAAWGEGCLERLLGDFAFAVWDGPARTLFCARAPFGLKPLFHARAGGDLVFASDLDAIRRHPGVGGALDDLAVADFLLFGHFRDPDATPFAEVRRLPAGHLLVWEDGDVRVRRWWTLPVEPPLGGERPEALVERTRELLWTAVEDRLRTDRAVVQMSGGLDSTAIMVAAHEILAARGAPFHLGAHTHVVEELLPHDERRYAEMVARHLDVPVRWFPAEEHPPLRGVDMRPWPEPKDTLLTGFETAEWRSAAEAGARVVLSGVGADEVLRPPRSYLLSALGRGAVLALLGDVARQIRRHRRLPGLGIRTALRDQLREDTPWPFPDWLEPGLVERLDLRRRWREAHARRPGPRHPLHPEAYALLTSPLLGATLETMDPGSHGFAVECRLPFLDLRLVRFLLRVPVRYEWLRKGLLRQGLAGRLPEAVRLRPKSPLTGDLLSAWLDRVGTAWLEGRPRSPRLARYVRKGSYPSLARREDSYIIWSDFRAVSLNEWLLSLDDVG